jgi:phosphohistidine phosphatase
MPRYLYLLRHAQSAEKQIGQSDRDRELVPDGVKQSLLIASYLRDQKIKLDIIMCSVAERAKATAGLISDALKFDLEKISVQDDLYEASTRTFFQFVTQLEDHLQHVMCVAHNPAISYLAEYFSKAEIGEMAPGGMAVLRFDINSWKEVSQGNGELLHYVYPEMLMR